MGKVDDFLRGKVTPLLGAGETIEGMGLLQRPTKISALGVPQKWEPWLAVSTPSRLILFKTETGGLANNTAKPVAKEMAEWLYEELERVELGSVGGVTTGRTMTLWPYRLCGPFPQENRDDRGKEVRRYDIYSKANGLDAHADFAQNFPQWLHDQVAADAFALSPERRAEIDARIGEAEREAEAKAKAERADKERRAAERSATVNALLPKIGKALFALFLVVATLGCGGGAAAAFLEFFGDIGRNMHNLDRAKNDLKWAKKGYKLPRNYKGLSKSACPTAPECHKCRVLESDPGDEGSALWPVVKKRKGLYWQCPAVKGYNSYKSKVEDAQEGVTEAYMLLGVGIGSAGGVFVFPLIGLVLLIRSRRRKKA